MREFDLDLSDTKHVTLSGKITGSCKKCDSVAVADLQHYSEYMRPGITTIYLECVTDKCGEMTEQRIKVEKASVTISFPDTVDLF